MKTVFTNDETAHVWAQNSQESGRSGNGQFYFTGPALFSYGPHYLAGFIMPDGTALLNDDSYSVTTRRHMNYASSAVSHRTRHWIPDLTAIGPALAYVARRDGEERPSGQRRYVRDMQDAQRDVRDWAVAVLGGTYQTPPQSMTDSALAYVLRVVGLSRSMAKIKRDAAAKIAKRKAAKAAEIERESERLARLRREHA